jgi:hypothetical protein
MSRRWEADAYAQIAGSRIARFNLKSAWRNRLPNCATEGVTVSQVQVSRADEGTASCTKACWARPRLTLVRDIFGGREGGLSREARFGHRVDWGLF